MGTFESNNASRFFFIVFHFYLLLGVVELSYVAQLYYFVVVFRLNFCCEYIHLDQRKCNLFKPPRLFFLIGILHLE